eukprot:11347445-Heterocapsa_arctica.AAC.1
MCETCVLGRLPPARDVAQGCQVEVACVLERLPPARGRGQLEEAPAICGQVAGVTRHPACLHDGS